MAQSRDKGGGAFLTALREKNEAHQTQARAEVLAATKSVRSGLLSKKSFMGSFRLFGKPSSVQKEAIKEAQTESTTRSEDGSSGGPQQPQSSSDGNVEPALSDAPVQPTVRKERPSIDATSGDGVSKETNQVAPRKSVVESKSLAEPSISIEGGSNDAPTPQLQSERHDSIRLVASVGIMQTVQSDMAPPRQRRASTTVESHISRRMSSSGSALDAPMDKQHRDSHVRDRVPSVAGVDDVYSRAGRNPRKFEMSNPLLDPAEDRMGGRRLSTASSAVNLEHDRQKRESLYNSATHHVDQTLLLERRNTRSGRRPSVDSTQLPQPLHPASSSPHQRRSLVEVANPLNTNSPLEGA